MKNDIIARFLGTEPKAVKFPCCNFCGNSLHKTNREELSCIKKKMKEGADQA